MQDLSDVHPLGGPSITERATEVYSFAETADNGDKHSR
jgi:hypothetical protein